MTARVCIACVVITTLVAAPSLAAAQDGDRDAADAERARALFEEASRAREDGRWADARTLLERSLEADPRFSTAWNLVTAYERTDDLVAAERLLERLRDGETGPLDARAARSVEERLAEIAAELSTIVVLAPAGEPGAIVLDGEARFPVSAEGQARLRVVPGVHVVAFEASDGRRAESSVEVERGATRRVRLALVTLSSTARPSREDRGGDDGSIWESPWLWAGVGAIVIAAGVVAAVLLVDGPVRDPVQADFQPPPL